MGVTEEGPLRPIRLRVEGLANALGLDEPHPRLSWHLSGSGRNRKQSAYEVVVGREGDPLIPTTDVVWDSGLVLTDESVNVEFSGRPLLPRTRYLWRVRVTDESSQRSEWSDLDSFETGLVDPRQWQASWISAPSTPYHVGLPSLDNVSRIWLPEPNDRSLAKTSWFRRRFDIPIGIRALSAPLVLAGAGTVEAYINGLRVQGEYAAGAFVSDVIELIQPGTNVLAVKATPCDGLPGGIVGRLDVLLEDTLRLPYVPSAHSPSVTVATSHEWLATGQAPDDWCEPRADESSWAAADVVGVHSDPPWGRERVADRPSPYLRRQFDVDRPIRRARLYATALGVYELRLNGERVGRDRLAPGWTDYHKRVAYQTYDVTDLLVDRANVVGAILADGWYAGNTCWLGPYRYGRRLQFRAELDVCYDDDTHLTVATDRSWRAGCGQILYADLLNGESHDHGLEPDGWDRAGFDPATWQRVTFGDGTRGQLEAQESPPIRVQHEIPPVEIRRSGPDKWIVDFGQNLVGWVRLRVSGRAGQRIIIRHAEILDSGGDLYTENLRSARATDEYVLRGDQDETCEPRFTVHGFRFAEISGCTYEPAFQDIAACVAYADMQSTGAFACSNPMLEQLQRNILWSQRGNFLAVPTDCPQRDERLGFTGDAQVFVATAAFNMDVQRFFHKWLRDLADAQYADGAITHVAPDVLTGPTTIRHAGYPGWGDAIVIVPAALRRAYADDRPVLEALAAMRRWLDYCAAISEDGVFPAEGFGDWLSVGADTPKDLIGTAFFAYSSCLVAELLGATGNTNDSAHYHEMHRNIRTAFRKRFVDARGGVSGGTQAAYVLAIHTGMLEGDEIARAGELLVADIAEKGWHLSTGFLATPLILSVLTDTGHLDVAYRLLLQESFPSWLYPIIQGDATTMWERWDGWKADTGVQDPAMNSFNHYAYGSVGAWIYRTVLGIDAAAPGYRKVAIRPRPGGRLTWVEGSFDSVNGPIAVRWDLSGGEFTLRVDLPPNTTAEVCIPTADADGVREGDRPATEVAGIRLLRTEGEHVAYSVGSGCYVFRAATLPATPIAPGFGEKRST